MSKKRIGMSAVGGDANLVLARVEEIDRLGIQAAWLTTSLDMDPLTMLGAVALRTEQTMLGTCIVPTWLRHPFVAAQQAQVLGKLAPGRFRLGVGPGHRMHMSQLFNIDFRAPLTNLKEYIHVVRTLLRTGEVSFDGSFYQAHLQIPEPVPGVSVMASALRRKSFEFCGAETDGAISWLCPGVYLRDVALPSIKYGAEGANRPTPPLIGHVPVCPSDVISDVRSAVRAQMGLYPQLPFYSRMFTEAGFSEEEQSGGWSDRMIDSVVIWGNDGQIIDQLHEFFSLGVSEVVVSVVTLDSDITGSWKRTMDLVADVARTL